MIGTNNLEKLIAVITVIYVNTIVFIPYFIEIVKQGINNYNELSNKDRRD